jgi:tRNA nucleotidyltransferase/poly(A) polymerase
MLALQSHNLILDALARYPLIDRVFTLAAERGMPIYLVGGTVRDLVLGRDTHDLDFAVQGSGLELARYIADRLGGYFVPLDRERRTGRVLLAHADPPDLAPGTPRPGSKPQHLDIASLRGDNLRADLEGRDFTLNAIAIAHKENGWRLNDPLNGHQDLQQGILRAASPASFDSDPVRTLRAVRMQFQFDCTLEPQTRDRLRSAVPLLKHVSAERVRDEWFKILQLENAATALKEMTLLGLLHEVAPWFDRVQDLTLALAMVREVERLWAALNEPVNQQSTGAVRLVGDRLCDVAPHLRRRYTAMICDERSYLVLLKSAALLHGTRASRTELSAQWKLSKREVELLYQAIHHHPEVGALIEQIGLTRRAIYRFFAQTGEPGIDAAMVFMAHTLAHGAPGHGGESWKDQTEGVAQLLNVWFEHHDTQIAPTPLLSGQDIMHVLAQPAGPQIGELLRALIEEQAAGKVCTRQQALDYIKQRKSQIGAENSGESVKESDG